MEKRRRERINHSLETLRLLMLEGTQNEVRHGFVTVIVIPGFLNVFSNLVANLYCGFLHLETEESKGGEGRDSGERGPLPEDREGWGQSHVQEPGLQCPPAQLPWRHEVLPATGQPLHSHQEPGGRGSRWRCSSVFSCAPRGADTRVLIRTHPQDTCTCWWLFFSGSSGGPPSQQARTLSSVPHRPPRREQEVLLLQRSVHEHHWPRIEALASVTDTWDTDFYLKLWSWLYMTASCVNMYFIVQPWTPVHCLWHHEMIFFPHLCGVFILSASCANIVIFYIWFVHMIFFPDGDVCRLVLF